MRDEIRVQEVADFGGIAPARIFVVIGDEGTQIRGVAGLGGSLGFVDQGADLVFRRAGGTAAGKGKGEGRREREAAVTQGEPPIAAGRR